MSVEAERPLTVTRKSLDPARIKLKDWSEQADAAELAPQYWPLYLDRLKRLRATLQARVAQQWPSLTVAARVLDAHSLHDDECVIIGALFKEMKQRPSPLSRFTDSKALFSDAGDGKVSSQRESLVSEDDKLSLEDENGSVQLVLSDGASESSMDVDMDMDVDVDSASARRSEMEEVGRLVTGLCVAVRGVLDTERGVFIVSGFLLPGTLSPPPPPPLPSSSTSVEESESKKLLIVGGLSIGNPSTNPLLLESLCDLVCNEDESIVRIIVAGDSVSPDSSNLSGAMAELDAYLAQLATTVPVDLMPGALDPCANATLPQTGFHKCLLPMSSSMASTLACVSNPYSIRIAVGEADAGESICVLGTSGQNVADMRAVSTLDSDMDCLRLSYEARCIAPTAPDTLACAPLARDPFVIEEAPNLYFAANCERLDHCVVDGCRLLTVPSFATTGQCVLVDLENFNCQTLEFAVGL